MGYCAGQSAIQRDAEEFLAIRKWPKDVHRHAVAVGIKPRKAVLVKDEIETQKHVR